MGEPERAADPAKSGYVITRSEILDAGGSESSIRRKIDSGVWVRRHPGVFQVDARSQTWEEKLWSAVRAGGEGALVSHRAALVLWGLDGLSSAPLELTVRYEAGPIPAGVIVHRTRRIRDQDFRDGIPITSVPRTLLDCASLVPSVTLTKALDSAVRLGYADLDSLWDFVAVRGGPGVKGTRSLRGVISLYIGDRTTGSPAESEAYFHICHSDIPKPVLQQEFVTRTGRRALPDFYWPDVNKAVEIDGLGSHSSADSLEDDLARQNELLELGIELRRFTARQVRRNPKGFIDDLKRFLDLP
jgi:very-short-patch-repair endonuclease